MCLVVIFGHYCLRKRVEIENNRTVFYGDKSVCKDFLRQHLQFKNMLRLKKQSLCYKKHTGFRFSYSSIFYCKICIVCVCFLSGQCYPVYKFYHTASIIVEMNWKKKYIVIKTFMNHTRYTTRAKQKSKVNWIRSFFWHKTRKTRNLCTTQKKGLEFRQNYKYSTY